MAGTVGVIFGMILALMLRSDFSVTASLSKYAIIGGGPVREEQFPEVGAIVDLSSAGTRSLVCTGTMIGKDTVLTAAHCVVGAGHRSLVFTRSTDLAHLG